MLGLPPAQICVVAPIGGVDRWTLLSRALCLGSTDTQSTADMGRPPRGTSAHFFCTVSAACAVCLPVLCVCDVCVCAGYVSQHTALVLTSHHLVPTLQHLVLSRTISHQSPQHLVPVSHTDLAASCAIGANLARSHVQTFRHLDRSRGTISHRSRSTILHRPRSTISCRSRSTILY